MKTTAILHALGAALFAAALCACSSSSETNEPDNSLLETVDSLNAEIATLRADYHASLLKVAALRDSVELLRYSPTQRLDRIKELIAAKDTDAAEREIKALQTLFPQSAETVDRLPALRTELTALIDAQKAEQQRQEALGFKALKAATTIKVDYNTVTLSGFSISNRFTFDSYDDSYYYRDADRDNKYVTMAMSVKSESKSPDIPEFALYSISGKEMLFVTTFTTRYARWRDYGAYLGNYTDSNNDFAKVSTVRFKLGAEAPTELVSKQPFAIVMKNSNVLSEGYERFNNPPKYWLGTAAYPSRLTLSDFNDGAYTLIKLYNL